MGFQFHAPVGAGVQLLDPHGGQLAVEGLDPLAVGAQGERVGPVVRAHVGLAERHQPHAGLGQDRRLVGALSTWDSA